MTQALLNGYLLRDLHPWDAAGLFRLTGDPAVMRYMGFRQHQTVDDASRLIETYSRSPSRFLAVCPEDDATDILGLIGTEPQGHQVAMTVMFRSDWRARGVARRLCVPYVQWIFTHSTVWRVWAYCHVDNVPVQRVLERMGAGREGRLRRFEFFPNVSESEPQDCYLYSITR